MKIRIRDNSLRFRLARAEVDDLHANGVMTSTTRFPDNRQFAYSLQSSPASVSPAAFYSDNKITVRLPETVVLAWATTEQVSIMGEQLLDSGEKLSILVEKDFACLAPRDGEDESDMYPHPEADNEKGGC